MNEAPVPRVKSAERAIDILSLLAGRVEGLTLLEIGAELGLAKSSVFGLMATLLDRKVVRLTPRDGRSVYQLDHRIFEIGQAYAQTTDLLGDGLLAVQELSVSSGETAHLAVLDGNEVVYLAKHESAHAVRMVSAVGRRLSAHGSGVGKVLLAGLSDEEVTHRFGSPNAMPTLTARTVTDIPTLLAHLTTVRARGFATEREESTEGVACVAAPVYDATGMVAAVSLAIPVGRFPETNEPEIAQRVRAAAGALSVRLGAGQYPHRITPTVVPVRAVTVASTGRS